MNEAIKNTPQNPMHEFYSRSVGFIACSVMLGLAHQQNIWSFHHTEFIIVALFYPILALLISKKVPAQKEHLRLPFLILVDAIFVGILMAYMEFAILPSILFAIIVNTSSIVLGRFSIWLACVLCLAIGGYLGTLIVGFRFTPQAPLIIEIIVALGLATHLAVTGYLSGKQTKLLEFLHINIKEQEQKHKHLANQVSKYISPQILESIFSGKQDVRLQTQRKKLVVFFSDIKGFTSLSEQIESEVLTDLLNNYLTEMTNIAIKYGGTIDKYIGDSIMVFFGDPKTQGAKKDTLACVAMAIEMRKHMKVLRQKWRSQGVKDPLEIRMGINTGYCTVGNFGTESRMDYTIIGKEVNMASRLESAADSNEILLSYESYALIQDKIICREKGRISAKGFSRPVPVYQVVDFRHNLAAKTTFVEHELPGFSMYMDTNNINNYDRERIAKALEQAASKIKNQNKMSS